MALVESKHPHNIGVIIEDRVRYIKTAIMILKDHINMFGKKINDQDPEAFKFILNQLKAMEQELQIRTDFPIKRAF